MGEWRSIKDKRQLETLIAALPADPDRPDLPGAPDAEVEADPGDG
jgi:hypothetical protein